MGNTVKAGNFHVEINGKIVAGFTECSALTSKIDVIEYREGGDREARKLPGKVSYDPIILKRGSSDALDSKELYEWHKKAVDGKTERKNGSIILLNDDDTEIKRWNFINAWPSAYAAPILNSDKPNDVAIESLTLVCERIEIG